MIRTLFERREGNLASNQERRKLFCQVIPTYNEAENIEALVGRLESIRNRIPFDLRIIVVDDNSSDGTADKVKELQKRLDNLSLVQRPAPAGIGSAYLDGFEYAVTNFNADYLGEIDADLQHPPEVLIEMCNVAASGNDVVIASRYVKGGGAKEWSFSRKIVSKGANLLTRIFLRTPVADSTSGYRVLSRKAVESLFGFKVSSKGYSFQTESLYAYKKSGMSFAEVPYKFEIRRAGKTKLNKNEMWQFAKTTIKTGIFGLRRKE
ncbi:MAG TPA: polyprenol monophosphomannose synthase [Nitrososphaerales archaeon]|nr:polyprenol monophosphomannose synthase [Nitrososphaerales archaeon]